VHINKLPALSFNSPSNPQLEDLVEETYGRHKFYFFCLFTFIF